MSGRGFYAKGLSLSLRRLINPVTDLLSYGGGIPIPEAADNPIRYKISWTFEGVLESYCREGRVIREGEVTWR